jgi:cytochrome o ubiquinol oxidase subunit 1
MLGRLTWAAIPFNEPLPLISAAVVAVVVLAVLVTITVKGWLPYLWREWVTSVDHKRIGVMYFALGLIMLLRGFSDAIMMRTQQAIAVGTAQGYLPPDHYNQIFSAHGAIMIFFVAMPFVIGLMNFVVPLQLGVRDVAFPVLNSVAFWLTASGALLINVSLIIGNFARTGWMGYPPLSELAFSPDVGVDYYLWSLQISGIGTLLGGINIVTTILKLRAPGMTYFRMPVFCWTSLASSLLIVAAFPILTATFLMLLLDRYLGMHFFTNGAGGNQMMYVNLFWAWGHPEVYILILPAFGVFSVFRQGAVRLSLDGARDARHLRPLLHGLATPLLHDGSGRRCQCLLRHHVDGDRGAHRGEGVQLAVHDVPRPDRVPDTGAVRSRLCCHLRDRRHDRGFAGGASGRFRVA